MSGLYIAFFAVLFAVVSGQEQQSILSCSFPNNQVPFGVFNGGEVGANEQPILLSPNTQGLSFNGVARPGIYVDAGLTYSSDREGSIALYYGTEKIMWEGSSMNDHVRWDKDGKFIVFTSTRTPSNRSMVSWSSVWTSNYQNGEFSPPQRVTLDGDSGEFSPALSDDNKVAVAVGSGEVGGTAIVVYPLDDPEKSTSVDLNGGWPTWYGDNVVIYHQPTTNDPSSLWLLFYHDLENGISKVLLENAMTPYVLTEFNLTVFTRLDQNGFRQIFSASIEKDNSGQLSVDNITQLTFDHTHHYNPTLFRDVDSGKPMFIYHQCRGAQQGSPGVPNIRKMVSVLPGVDIGFVVGDFPSVAPDASRMAWVTSDPVRGFINVQTFNFDGSDGKSIYDESAWMTLFSADSKSILFTDGPGFMASNDTDVQVGRIPVDGGDVKRLGVQAANQGYPYYEPTGDASNQRIVFRTGLGENPEGGAPGAPGTYTLSIMNNDGTNITRLTTDPEGGWNETNVGDTHCNWAADGIIVFSSDRGHPQQMSIWMIKDDGTNMKEIFDEGAMSVHPTVLPAINGGKPRIVFTSTYAGFNLEYISWPFGFVLEAELFVMDMDGSNVTRLTHDAGEEANAQTTPYALPQPLSMEGPDITCDYLDSVYDQPTREYEAEISFRFFPHANGVESQEEVIARTEKRNEEQGNRCPFKRAYLALGN